MAKKNTASVSGFNEAGVVHAGEVRGQSINGSNGLKHGLRAALGNRLERAAGRSSHQMKLYHFKEQRGASSSHEFAITSVLARHHKRQQRGDRKAPRSC
jgi:hypothetical protein